MFHLHFTTHKMVLKINCFILSHFYYRLLKQIVVRKRNDCDVRNRRLTSIYLLLPDARFHRFKRKKKRWIRLPISLGTHALVIEKDPTSQYNVISAVIIMYKVLWENQRERLLCLRKGRLQRRYTVWTGIKVSIDVFHEVKRQREWRWGWDWGLGWELVHWAGSHQKSPLYNFCGSSGELER